MLLLETSPTVPKNSYVTALVRRSYFPSRRGLVLTGLTLALSLGPLVSVRATLHCLRGSEARTLAPLWTLQTAHLAALSSAPGHLVPVDLEGWLLKWGPHHPSQELEDEESREDGENKAPPGTEVLSSGPSPSDASGIPASKSGNRSAPGGPLSNLWGNTVGEGQL